MRKILFFLSFIFVFSCQTDLLERGTQKEFSFYLPGNIAFLPSLSVQEHGEVSQLLPMFDEEILEAFEDQAFINGFGPEYVTLSLQEVSKTERLQTLKEMITSKEKRDHFIHFYEEFLKENPKWRLLLKEISEALSYCDALLLPLITKISEDHINDRGLLISRRTLAFTLLLIEVETGRIIWWERNEKGLSHQHLAHPPLFQYPDYPSWKKFEKKLMVRALWKNFPGWQY